MDKKPFACPVDDCDQTFANVDHLTVHKKKHELCLSLTPSTASFKIFADQTPTPTRFLTEYLQDFDNPFDATFRKANSSNGACHTFVIPESSSLISSLPDSEVLNTPSITLPSEPSTPITLKTNFIKRNPAKDNQTFNENGDTLPFAPEEQSCQNISQSSMQDPLGNIIILREENQNFITLSTDNIAEYPGTDSSNVQKNNAEKTTVVQTPVITSVGNSAILKANSIGVPTAVVVNHSSASSVSTSSQASITTGQTAQVKVPTEPIQPVIQSVCVTPMVQIMFRLPDGQTMPVQLPMMPAAPASTAQTKQNIAPATPQTNAAISTAKMKLQEAIKSNQKSSASKRNSSNGKAQAINEINILPDLEHFGLNSSPPSSPGYTTFKPGQNGRKRRDIGSDPEEKRKKSLERNRAAATRCREKRKQWITNLEKKADELAQTNVQLQKEVTQLRNEVTQLKTMLLAHKDCHVTQQQKASGYDAEKDYTTIRIITSVPDDVQRVPNISPLNSEYIEMEVGSVQGSNDASFASDGSETSSFQEISFKQ